MKNASKFVTAFGIGAGLMYFLDPDRGKRRRALVRDRAVHLSNVANREIGKKAIDLRNRAQGVWFETEKIFEDEITNDERLADQVRSRLGRLTSHPHAIDTKVADGVLILNGLILEDEEERLINGLSSMNGIKEIENYLEPHTFEENLPKLRGRNKKRASMLAKQNYWSPATRILIAAAGAGMAFWGGKKRDLKGSVITSAGVGLLARSVTNERLTSFLPQLRNEEIQVQKSITINAPPEKVYDVLKYPQYFPFFMSHVRDVERTGDRRLKWKVDGLAGYPVAWETEITDFKPNEFMEWKNADGPVNGQGGSLRLEKVDDETTRLHLQMAYEPYGGKIGHYVARLFERDPKSELDHDLLRMKTFIETGKPAHDAAVEFTRRKNMKVEEIMTKNPAFATPNTTLHDVAHMMWEHDCGSIPVVESEQNRKPVGIITDRDITVRTLAHNMDPIQKVAGEVMTENVISVTPDMSVEDCCHKMENNQIRRLLVVNDADELTGIVAQADIARTAPLFETAELVKDVSESSRTAAA